MDFLNATQDRAVFPLGDLLLRYDRHSSGPVELRLVPLQQADAVVPRRGEVPVHPALALPKMGTCHGEVEPDALVQVALRGEVQPNLFVNGVTMRNGGTTRALRLREQRVRPWPDAREGSAAATAGGAAAGGSGDWGPAREGEEALAIETELEGPDGLAVVHRVRWRPGLPGLLLDTLVRNDGGEPFVLEHLSSFSLAGLTPFAEDDAPGRLRLHRFRSGWSMEGRHEQRLLEDLHLERCWNDHSPRSLRYGQAGSMPVRGFFPWIGLEDKAAGACWGATVAWHGSWQMEAYRRADPVALSGGLGDFETAHWAKTLRPGEAFRSPVALVSACAGGVEDLCERLVRTQSALAHPEPDSEADLSMLFNEWCSSWGEPTHEAVVATAERIQETDTEVVVIDDGWAEKSAGGFQQNGDWVLDRDKFPGGMDATVRAVSERGLRTGIWFEFEVATERTRAFEETAHHLTRHGAVLQVGPRRFWDFRDPWVRDYLRGRVIAFLRENGLTYLKVDYNDSIGTGCDPVDEPTGSLGEGLRQHLEAVEDFFREIRRELPELVLEMCSSGGHRLEPGFIGMGSMSSFSDAHELPEIPVIAANLHRLVPVPKNQVWAVLHPEDTPERTAYSLAATFLGRMCLSGGIAGLSDAQLGMVREAQALYKSCVPVLRSGVSRLHRQMGPSYRHPFGWQALVRVADDSRSAMAVIHTFEHAPADPLRIPLPEGTWRVAGAFPGGDAQTEEGALVLPPMPDFRGLVVRLEHPD